MKKLIPKKIGQKINYEIWNQYSPDGHLEVWDGKPTFADPNGINKLLLLLIYTEGLENLVEILPEESKKELKKLLFN